MYVIEGLKQLELRENKRTVREKFPRQFSDVKARGLWRDWLTCEFTHVVRENKKNAKGEEEGKNCYLKFKNERLSTVSF